MMQLRSNQLKEQTNLRLSQFSLGWDSPTETSTSKIGVMSKISALRTWGNRIENLCQLSGKLFQIKKFKSLRTQSLVPGRFRTGKICKTQSITGGMKCSTSKISGLLASSSLLSRPESHAYPCKRTKFMPALVL